ncbi:hypothetical protein ATK36_2441 [Amycolatopsis sulphurea]|uniref:Uncharacterized protein n=1 Tax=Amycolatopsis sulphurea TaxID=76022 RepID=A0A2A9FA80_9PSEU|nr:hypothetical protein [Amycolatopsis sulphurea]PFG47400.1 hypothetical protein ATK36_2441 [Amycolatopsis sulphurea]
MLEVWQDAEETLDSGEMLGTEQETLIRLALNHVTWGVQEIGQIVHR